MSADFLRNAKVLYDSQIFSAEDFDRSKRSYIASRTKEGQMVPVCQEAKDLHDEGVLTQDEFQAIKNAFIVAPIARLSRRLSPDCMIIESKCTDTGKRVPQHEVPAGGRWGSAVPPVQRGSADGQKPQPNITTLSDHLLDHVLSALPLQELLAARLTGHLLHARVQRRFLPVITPPTLRNIVLSEEEHGALLVRQFAEYLKWLRRWQRQYHILHRQRRTDERRAVQLELRSQQSVADGFFSLPPWWRAFGEVIPTPWRPKLWLENSVYAATSEPTTKSAFYQRRTSEDDDDDVFRHFFSTPAEANTRKPLTKRIVLAPLNVRMSTEPVRSALASLPVLSDAMLAILEVAAELLRAYLPTLSVRIDPVRSCEVDRSMTRGDRQDARTDDGKRVRQLNSKALYGARDEVDAEAREPGEEPPFITFVIAPHLYPGDSNSFAWCYSTDLDEVHDPDHEKRMNAWAVSTHQIEAHVDPGPGQTGLLYNQLLYCTFIQAMDLEVLPFCFGGREFDS